MFMFCILSVYPVNIRFFNWNSCFFYGYVSSAVVFTSMKRTVKLYKKNTRKRIGDICMGS